MEISATIVIVTKNRKEELAKAIQSALKQSKTVEIIIIDDGSTDGTAQMVKNEYPTVHFVHSDKSCGYIVQRNLGARLAKSNFIISIDDDAELSSPNIVKQTLKYFKNPRIGVVAIPYVEPSKENKILQKPPESGTTWISESFKGTAHALKKDIFLKLGGYQESLVHQGEESDYSIRLLNAGYVVCLGDLDPIIHWESPKRDFNRMDFYGSRNNIIFVWQNVPMPYMPIHLIGTTFNTLRFTCNPTRFVNRLYGVLMGYSNFFTLRREPVQKQTYLLWREIRKHGAQPLDKIQSRLIDMR